jgi:hypothetical protein
MATAEPTIESLPGLWRRSLIAWPDGRSDTTTWVNWLQGPSFYVDLRQPAGRPGFRAVTCLDQLGHAQIAWLAGQQGFAGELHYQNGYFDWQREVDFQVKASYPDQGRLWFEDGIMVEEGKNLPYIEYWHRELAGKPSACALRLDDPRDGCHSFILRLGDLFMYARGRSTVVAPTIDLREHVTNAPTVTAAQDLIDCEISQGIVTPAGWIIRRSTLPFKEGRRLDPRLVPGRSAKLVVSELSRNGRDIERYFDIANVQGELDDFLPVDGTARGAMAGAMS